ncbi:MAG: PKD domain-containing protein, partial [Deltaproteobacteria bacterium]|nr:PKD domain-containing protein [Deltaproteobacteria bacterium]
STLTHALLEGSPAIDAGDPDNCTSVDQHGLARPYDGNYDSSAVCDIGAVEYRTPAQPQPTTTTTTVSGDNGGSSSPATTTTVPETTTTTTAAPDSGGSTTTTIFLAPPPACSVDIIADPVSGPASLAVSFEDFNSGDSPFTSCSWDFGDGETDDSCSTDHIYSEPGTYSVSLTVTTEDETCYAVRPDFITVSPRFQLFNNSISGTITGDIEAGVMLYLYGPDGRTMISEFDGSFAFEWLAAGDYLLMPVMSGYQFEPVSQMIPLLPDSQETISFESTALETQPQELGGSSTPDPETGKSKVVFTAFVPPAEDGKGTIVTVDLSPIGGNPKQRMVDNGTLGDLMAGDNVFTYTATTDNQTAPGQKPMTVTATDSGGKTSHSATLFDIVDQIVETVPPSGTFEHSIVNEHGGQKLIVQFGLGDLGLSTIVPDPTTPPPAPVPGGSTTTTVFASPPPACSVEILVDPQTGNAPLNVSFEEFNLGDSEVTGCSWDFGDGESSDTCSVDHLYAEPGIYTVTLAVTTENETCYAVRTDLITVNPRIQLANNSISGEISGAVGAGVVLYLYGPDERTTISDIDSSFAFEWLAAGDYLLMPVMNGYQFEPVSEMISLQTGGKETIHFESTALETRPLELGGVSTTDPNTGISEVVFKAYVPPSADGKKTTVTVDLSPIGGNPKQRMVDNGTLGDLLAGDNIFTYTATTDNQTAPGQKPMTVTATDSGGNTSHSATLFDIVDQIEETVPPSQTFEHSIVNEHGGQKLIIEFLLGDISFARRLELMRSCSVLLDIIKPDNS